MTRTFEEWMKLVDEACWSIAGCSVHDLQDVPFKDWFETGVSPKSAARKAVRNAQE